VPEHAEREALRRVLDCLERAVVCPRRFAQPVPDAARKAYDQAVVDLGTGKKDEEGLGGLKHAIELFPSYYDALQRLGAEYVKRRQYDLAVPVLVRAVEVNPRGYQSLYALGIAYYYTKNWRDSADAFRRATTLNPNSVNAHVSLGIALKSDGQLEQAEAALKRANELSKGEAADAHWQLALLYNRLKRYAAAADELEQFLRVTPDARDAEQIRKLIKQFREKAGVASSSAP
jgi:tetratricopeptide (TPR) repeat protein